MTETLRDMMAARADAAPGPNLDIQGVIRSGNRRVWRHRTIGGTAACAALAAVALVGSSLSGSSPDDSWTTEPANYPERKLTYASGSTIHDGNRTIDVSPHKVASYVQTDDGFVYISPKGRVYFTNGGKSDQIGRAGGFSTLTADDFGPYVGWISHHADSGAEIVVVYDTARHAVSFRRSYDASDQGCLIDAGVLVSAIDGDTAYLCAGDGISAWNLVTGAKQWAAPNREDLVLEDVSDEYLAWVAPGGDDTTPETVVSRDPDADEPRYEEVGALHLSPTADYMDGVQSTDDGWRNVLFDRTANEEVELAMPDYQGWYVMQWLDDHRFTAVGYEDESRLGADLLTCDASNGDCTVVGQASGRVTPPGNDGWWY